MFRGRSSGPPSPVARRRHRHASVTAVVAGNFGRGLLLRTVVVRGHRRRRRSGQSRVHGTAGRHGPHGRVLDRGLRGSFGQVRSALRRRRPGRLVRAGLLRPRKPYGRRLLSGVDRLERRHRHASKRHRATTRPGGLPERPGNHRVARLRSFLFRGSTTIRVFYVLAPIGWSTRHGRSHDAWSPKISCLTPSDIRLLTGFLPLLLRFLLL